MEGGDKHPLPFLEKKLLEKLQSDIDNFFVATEFAHSDIQNLFAVFVHIDGGKLSNIRNIHPVVFFHHDLSQIFEEIIESANVLMINSHAQCELAIIVKNHETSGVIVVIKLFENDLHNKFSLNLIVNKLNI